MAYQCDGDWQSAKKTVLERNSHMFNKVLMSDVKFTCGESNQKYFHAHKYVLATSSAVFFKMFYGDLPENVSPIHLPDTDEESFEAFLRFLYTDVCTITAEIAIKVLYLAKKYIVPSLTEKCVEVIQESLQPDNVLAVLEQALLFEEKELEKKCWEVVESQTRKVVASEAFCRITQERLIDILKRDNLSGIKEKELFEAVLKWSDAQCGRNDREATGENRRAVIGEALYEIRFLSMSENEFAREVSRSGLLTAEEVISIYDKFNGLESANLKWKSADRRPLLLRFKRFTDSLTNRMVMWNYQGRSDCISFSVNKPATFHGVYLFGDENGSEYEVSLEVDDVEVSQGTYISGVKAELKNSECRVCGFEVTLPTPIPLEEDKVVKVAARIRGPVSYYGDEGQESVEVDGFIITFSIATCEQSNGTSVIRGQFYEILLSTR